MNSDKVATALSASVRTKASQEQAMQAFAEFPDRTQADRRSGPVDDDGKFPVFLTPPMMPMIEELHFEPELSDEDETQTTLEAEGDLEEIEVPDEIDEMPDYWVKIDEQMPDYQKASILMSDGLGGFNKNSTIEYRLDKSGNGLKVTETETLEAFEQGMRLGMWITDYQKDGLIMRRDRLESLPERAIRTQQQDSLLAMLGRMFMRRMMKRGVSGHELGDE